MGKTTVMRSQLILLSGDSIAAQRTILPVDRIIFEGSEVTTFPNRIKSQFVPSEKIADLAVDVWTVTASSN